jgi:hypothetical protein
MTLFSRVLTAGMLLSGFLHADTLDIVSATWQNLVGGAGTSINVANGTFNDVRWGTNTPNSGLGFDGIAPPAQVLPALGNPFLLGSLRHYNNPINSGTAASSVDLAINTNMTIGGNAIATGPFNFRFLIDETPNAEPCAYPSVTPCADKISFQNLLSSDTFTIGSNVYTINILGFASTLGGPIVSDFISQEGGTNTAFLYASISAPASSVPEPASIAFLLTIGAAVIVPLRRRSKA